jgi:hypothetical protein
MKRLRRSRLRAELLPSEAALSPRLQARRLPAILLGCWAVADLFDAAIAALLPDLIQVRSTTARFATNCAINLNPPPPLPIHQHSIFEPGSISDTSCDCVALLAALDGQGFQAQLQSAVMAQQQRAHTLGLQQETHGQVQTGAGAGAG